MCRPRAAATSPTMQLYQGTPGSAPAAPSHRHTCGLAQPADLEEPAPLLHHCGQTPLVFTLWLPQEAPQVDKALWVTRSPSTRGEDRGRSGASLQEKVTVKPGGRVPSHVGTWQVPNLVTARCAQRRAPPATRCAGNSLHGHGFSPTPLF